MAGIGFELRKIFGNRTLTAGTLGVLHVSASTIGSSLYCTVLLLGIRAILRVWQVDTAEEMLFTSTFVYVSLLTIFISSLMSGVLSRYVSDKIVTEKEQDIEGGMFGVLVVGGVATALGAGVLSFFLHKQGMIDSGLLPMYYLVTMLMANACVLVAYYSALKENKQIGWIYIAGGVTFCAIVGMCYVMGFVNVVGSIYTALGCSLFVINLLLIRLCLKAFGFSGVIRFDFFKYFIRYGTLLWSGLFFFLGIYGTVIVYRLFSGQSIIVSGMESVSAYEEAIFLALLCNLPGYLLFELKIRKGIFDKYIAYLYVMEGGTFTAIDEKRENLQKATNLKLSFVYGMQLVMAAISICLIFAMKDYLGVSDQMIGHLIILGVGMCFVFCMHYTLLVMGYFLCYREIMLNTMVFCIIVVSGAVLNSALSLTFYTLPLLAGGIVGWIVAFFVLKNRLNNLNAYLLCK